MSWVNTGTVVVTAAINAGNNGIQDTPTASFTNAAGGVFNLAASGNINNLSYSTTTTDQFGNSTTQNYTGSSTFANAGTLEHAGGSSNQTSYVYSLVTDTGTIISAIGTLEFDGGGTFSGAISGAGAVAFGGGDASLNQGTKITSGGLGVDGAWVTLDTNLAYAGAFTQTGGELVLNGNTLTLSGANTLGGIYYYPPIGNDLYTGVDGAGVFDTSGSTAVTAGLDFSGGVSWVNTGTVVVTATINAGNNNIQDTPTASFTNAAGAVFNLAASGNIGNAYGTSTFNNAGTLEHAGGAPTQTSYIDSAITDTGSIISAIGTLEFDGGGTFSGPISGAGTVAFRAGTYTLAAGGSIAANTSLLIDGGVLIDNGTINSTSITVTGGTLVLANGIITSKGFSNTGYINASGTIAGITNTGIIDASGGLLQITGPVTGNGSFQIDNTGTLEISAAVAETISFNGAGGTLVIDNPSLFTGTIKNFVVGDVIILKGTPLSSAATSTGAITLTKTAGGTVQYTTTNTAGNVVLTTSTDANKDGIVTAVSGVAAPVVSITGITPDTGRAGDDITQSRSITLAGTATPSTTVSIQQGTTAIGSTQAVSGSGAWTFTVPGSLADGTYNYTATATDSYGDVSTAPATLAVTIVNTPPAAPVITGVSPGSVVAGSFTTGSHNLTFSGTTAPRNIITLTLNGYGTIGTVTASSTGAWSFTDPTTLPSAIYSLAAVATDGAGNVSAPGTAIIAISNGPAPVVSLAPTPTASNTVKATLGTASAGTAGDAVTVTLTADAAFTTGSSIALANGALTYTPGLVTAAKAGADIISYTVTDTTTGAVTAETQTVTLSNGPAPIVTLAAAPSASNTTTATLGTAAPGVGTDALAVHLTSDAVFASGSTLALTNGSLIYTPGAITTAGTDTLAYTVTDTITGAVTQETQTVTLAPAGITLSAAASAAALSVSGFGTLVAGQNTTQTAPSTVTIAAGVGNTAKLFDNGTQIGSGAADSNGNVTITTAAIGLGANALSFITSTGTATQATSQAVTLTVAPVASTSFAASSGPAKLSVGNGQDTLYFGNAGPVSITTGNGYDTIVGGDAPAALALGSGGATVNLGNGNDTVSTTNDTNAISAGSGNDTITLTGKFTNRVTLGNGNDSVTAADGNTGLTLGGGTNTVSLGNGNNQVTTGNGSSTITAGNGNNFVQVGNGANTISFGSGTDALFAGGGNNIVTGGSGTDQMFMGAGNNTLMLGSGTDSVVLAGGNNSLTGTSGNKGVQIQNFGTNSVTFGGGNDTIIGAGSDTITLGDGNDLVALQDGHDVITAGNGTDTVDLNNLSNTASVALGNGNDTVIESIGGSTVVLGSGNNTVFIAGGTNTVTAGLGTNTINGGSGTDVFNVGHGYVNGNGLSDTFNLGTGGGSATGGFGTNVFNVGAGQWYIGADLGQDTITLKGTSSFAYVQTFDLTKTMLDISVSGFGITSTAPVSALLSTTTDGTFSGSSVLFSYNATNGALYFRPSASGPSSFVALLGNHPASIAGNLALSA